MKGWKTLIFGLLLAIAQPAMQYFEMVDWRAMGLSPGWSATIGAAVIALRIVTKTPMVGRRRK